MNDCLIKFLNELRKISNQHINILSLFIFFFCSSSGIAQHDLKSLLELSRDNKVKDNIAKLEREILNVSYSTQRNIIPSISLGLGEQLNFGRSFDPISGEVTPRDSWYNSSNFSLKIQQKLTPFFQTSINNKINRTNQSIQELTRLQEQKNLDIEIVNNYYDCLNFRGNVELRLYLKDILMSVNHGYNKLYELKKIDTLSILSRQRQIMSLDKEIFTYLNNYLKSKIRLKSLVGIEASRKLLLTGPRIELNNTIAEFSENEISIEQRLFKKEYELDSLRWRQSKIESFANINFHSSFGSYYSSTLNYQFDFWEQINLNNFFNVGLSIELPLYSKEKRNAIISNKLRAKITKNKASLKLRKIKAFWDELKVEYESEKKLFNTLTKLKDVSIQEFIQHKHKFDQRRISVMQFLQSYANLKESYIEYLYYKYTLLKQRDILWIVFGVKDFS